MCQMRIVILSLIILLFIPWHNPESKVLHSQKIFLAPNNIKTQETTPEIRESRKLKKQQLRESAMLRSLMTQDPGAASYVAADGSLFINQMYRISLAEDYPDSPIPTKTYFRWNDGHFLLWENQIYPVLNGWNELSYFTEDQLGNREPEKTQKVYLDTAPPEISFRFTEEPTFLMGKYLISKQNKLTIQSRDVGVGIRYIVISLNQESLMTIESDSWEFQPTSEGLFQVSYQSFDKLGNKSAEKMLELVFDISPPELKIETSKQIINEGQNQVCPRDTQLHLFAKDHLSQIKEILWKWEQNGEWQTIKQDIDIDQTFPFQNEISLYFKAKDYAGNESVEQSFSCKRDRTPPETQLRMQK